MSLNDKKIIVIALIVAVIAFATIIGFVGRGNVRHVEIFWPEQVQQTVAFKEINGKVTLIGISGTGEAGNPTLIMRTGFAYVLTVVNEGQSPHQLYIDGIDVQTKVLLPKEKDSITIYTEKEEIYNYYDNAETPILLGQIKAVSVVPSDEFSGIFRDLI